MTRPESPVNSRRELLGEQERRADVLVEEVVDVLGGEVAEPAVAAARVVGDEDVERAERVVRGLRRRVRARRIGEVGLHERHAELGATASVPSGSPPHSWPRSCSVQPWMKTACRPRAGAA